MVFQKKILLEDITTVKITKPNEDMMSFKEVVETVVTDSSETIELLDQITEDSPVDEIISIKNKEDKISIIETSKEKKSYNILGLIIVFIISFIALIIVFDTFQKPISGTVPNIEFLLYNLYETFNDIVLFLKDLI